MNFLQLFLFAFVFNFIGCSDLCRDKCYALYKNNLDDSISCSKGCHISENDPNKLNGVSEPFYCKSNCEQSSLIVSERAACFEGCINVEPTPINNNLNNDINDGVLSWLMNFMYNSSFPRLFNPAEDTKTLKSNEDHPVITVFRFRAIMPIDENAYLDAGKDSREVPNSDPFVQHFVNSVDDSVQMRSASSGCRMFRSFSRIFFSNPLTFALSFFILVSLISVFIISCLRCRLRRRRADALKRQMQKMPAYFEPACIKINIASPQPKSEKEKEAESLL